MTYPVLKQHTAGKTVYIALTNSAGLFLDFSDYTLKTLVSATTPSMAATERTDTGGAGKSHYVTDLILSSINNSGSIKEFFVTAYEQAGGTPNLATDSVISAPSPLSVQFGNVSGEDVKVRLSVATKSTNGTTLQTTSWLEIAGEKVDLTTIDPTATCAVEIKQHGSTLVHIDLLTTDFTLNIDNLFQSEITNASWTGDNLYTAKVTIVENGKSWIEVFSFNVLP